MERWIGKLFFAVVLLQLVPVWAAPYFPTSDGPSHVYNAFVLRELMLGHGGAIARTYAVDWHPYPNLLGHVILAMLLGIFPAAVAEKIVVSAIIVLFAAGVWMFSGAADRRARIHAFLALPLAHHFFLHFGFYNFSISVGLVLVTMAIWWRRRDDPGWKTIALIALLILLCYTSHPLSTLLLIGFIGLLWLFTLRGRPLRRHARHLIALLPALPLLAWFSRRERGASAAPVALQWDRLRELVQPKAAVTCDFVQLRAGEALVVVIAVLIVVTAIVERRRGEIDAFAALIVAGVAAVLAVPSYGAGIIVERVAFIALLLPLPWLTPRLTHIGRAALAAVLSLATAANVVLLTKHTRAVAGEMTALIRAARAIPADTTMLPLVYDRKPVGEAVPVFLHAASYAAIERRLVDADNYEPVVGYFPVRFREGVTQPDQFLVEADPANLDVEPWAPFAQYVFTWHMPPDAPLFARLDRHYKLLEISNEARIYRRRE